MPPVVAGTRREYYLPGRWVPHYTIAEGLEPDDICITVELARGSGVCRVRICLAALLLYRSCNTPDTAAATAPAHACRPCSERCSWSSLSSRGTSLQTMA